LVLAAAFVAAAIIVLLGGRGAAPATAASERLIDGPSAAVAERFARLREPVTAKDEIPAGPKAAAGGVDLVVAFPSASAGFNPALAHRSAPNPKSRIWVAPGAGDSVCMVNAPIVSGDVTPVVFCRSLADTLAGKQVRVTGRAPKVEISGIVPDGVEQVVVRLADGSTAVAPVVDNAYDVIVEKPTASISFTDGQATTTFDAPSIDGPAARG